MASWQIPRNTIEVIPEDRFSEDDKALGVDHAAFRSAQRALLSASRGTPGSNNCGGQDEVVHAQLRAIEVEEQGEEDEEEQPEGDWEGGEEEDVYGPASVCRAAASALERIAEWFGGHWRLLGITLESALQGTMELPTRAIQAGRAKRSMPGEKRALKDITQVRRGSARVQEAISGAAGAASGASGGVNSARSIGGFSGELVYQPSALSARSVWRRLRVC
ncbi:hypothetical protein DFP73DRAFT_601651 [Morchella snyderi]|nr:hypothetical protein DFP73DRAFT_601651 [Morchella snyderi]